MIAVSVQNVSKSFRLPHDKTSSIKGAFVHAFRNRTYETQRVLDGISFTINEGDFFGVVGKNGSGKSTLLKLLAGVYVPDSGEILVHGRLTPFIELGVGFNPELTGRENVFLNGALLGFSNAQMQELYADIVEFAELERFMDQKLKNYSSGMQVRLAFSIATRAEAPIILLDEVLAVGDIAFQRKCYNYFKDLKRKGRTVILVTHDMDAVREFCDRGILLHEGAIALEGSAQELAREYTRLFSGKADTAGSEKSSGRWGDEKISYTAAKVTKTKNGMLELHVSAKAAVDVDNPVFGFVIRSIDGRSVLGTNTHIKGESIDTVKQGASCELNWKMPSILSNGKYVVDVAITQKDGATVHDWWESAATLEITGKDKTPYIVSPDITVSRR